MEELQSWIVIEEASAPEAPLVRFDLALLAWIDVRSRVRATRSGLEGTRLENLEENQGLDQEGLALWSEGTLGDKVRGGADVSYFLRGGGYQRQEGLVAFDGVHIAAPGDYVETRFEYLSIGGFVEWDALYGRTYRLGLVGGLRYFRLDIDMQAARARSPFQLSVHTRGELISPFFGGLIELTPFPYLSVSSRVQFMNWSWEEVNLQEARYLQFRLGVSVHPVPEVLSIGLEYRFLIVRAEGTDRRNRITEGALAANGVALSICLSY
jgi:hypothetical protein